MLPLDPRSDLSSLAALRRWTPSNQATTWPCRMYLVCATERSGSGFLCGLLQRSGLAGRPLEYFTPVPQAGFARRWGVSGPSEYFAQVIERGTGPNGVFGVKILRSYLDHLTHQLRELFGLHRTSTAALLNAAFPNTRYVWISRRDKVRQAVSLHRARQTGVWRSFDQPKLPPEAATFDFVAMDRLVNRVSEDDAAWKAYFEANGIEPFHVVYEDLLQAPEDVAVEILRFLEVPFSEPVRFGESRLRRQAGALSEEWVERYHRLKQQDKAR